MVTSNSDLVLTTHFLYAVRVASYFGILQLVCFLQTSTNGSTVLLLGFGIVGVPTDQLVSNTLLKAKSSLVGLAPELVVSTTCQM